MKPESEQVLRRVVLGQLAADAPEVCALVKTDAEFDRELAATLSVLHALERERSFREAVLADVERDRSNAPMAGRTVRTRAAWWIPLVAAAAVIALVFAIDRLGDDGARRRDHVPLGGGKITCLAPVGLVGDFARFEWQSESLQGWFELVVLDASGAELTRTKVFDASAWQPGAELHSRWPELIEWTIEWYDDSGNFYDRDSASAQRRQ
jgi:hypothetical protein